VCAADTVHTPHGPNLNGDITLISRSGMWREMLTDVLYRPLMKLCRCGVGLTADFLASAGRASECTIDAADIRIEVGNRKLTRRPRSAPLKMLLSNVERHVGSPDFPMRQRRCAGERPIAIHRSHWIDEAILRDPDDPVVLKAYLQRIGMRLQRMGYGLQAESSSDRNEKSRVRGASL